VPGVSATDAHGPDYAVGWDACLERVRAVLEAGRRYDMLPAAAAMVEVGLLDVEAVEQVLSRSAPPERPKEVEGGNVRH
jgi:hypothetical protein